MVRERAAVAVAVVLAGLTAGCGSSIGGSAVSEFDSAPRHIGAELASMALEPSAFPDRYPAVVLPAQEAAQASADLTGVADGARIDPAGCKPPEQDRSADGIAIVVGTAAARTTISVELARTDKPLSALRDHTEQCLHLTTTKNGVTAAVRTELLPAPPIDADDTIALIRTVESGDEQNRLAQSMRTLAGQIGDVRILATYMSFGSELPDTTSLDEVFTAAVERIRNA